MRFVFSVSLYTSPQKSVFTDDAMSSVYTQASGEIRKNVGMLVSSGHRTC